MQRYLNALFLYLNYTIHGMAIIILALHMPDLSKQWSTDAAGVSVVISSLGLGRLSVLYVAGILSDRFGRRPFVLLGGLTYICFFLGIVNTESLTTAYVCGFLAGCANSFLDAGTYPRLLELFPKSPGPAVIMIKAFVSLGQGLLPFIIAWLAWSGLWFGWCFVAAAAGLAVNFIVILCISSPQAERPRRTLERKRETGTAAWLDVTCYALFGYVGMATFQLVSNWLAQYGELIAGMPRDGALRLLSFYTAGSLIGVFLSSAALRTFLKPRVMLVLCTTVSFLSLVAVTLFPTPLVVTCFAFVFGVFAAGGVLQLGLALLAAQFPEVKGRATGIYYSAGSIATFSIPLVTAWISRHDSVMGIFLFDAAIAFTGVLLACFIAWRSRQAVMAQKAAEQTA